MEEQKGRTPDREFVDHLLLEEDIEREEKYS